MIFLFDHTSINPLSPTAFTIFGIEIGWYGIFIMTGALIALIVGLRAAKRLGIDENLIIDGFLWGLIIGVVGARLWYVFSEWDLYKDDPITIITGMRSGGLAIHGAVVFAGTFAVLFCLKKKINLWVIVEFLATGFLIGQIFGRWG
ncbi:MAG: prolipoprotein diacylglyceryl transferase, partial [Bacilli bacterium]|nr:prolipoprotein diacylglyceryl transferase [Bacilli bacterium]